MSGIMSLLHDDDGDAVVLPMEILTRILPFAWDTLGQSMMLQLVCRSFHAEAESPAFWARWLERRERELFDAVRLHDSGLLKTLDGLYQRVPACIKAAGMRAVIRSKLPPMAGHDGFAQTLRLQLFEGHLDSSGERNGPCALYYSDGDAYFGTVRQGVFSGIGEYQWQCGMRYVGGFKRQFRAGPVSRACVCRAASTESRARVASRSLMGRVSCRTASTCSQTAHRSLLMRSAATAMMTMMVTMMCMPI